MKTKTRREFLKIVGGMVGTSAALTALSSCSAFSVGNAVEKAKGANPSIPSYLRGYEDLC